MVECENFFTFSMPDICQILDQKDQIWSDFIAHTKPRAKFPFQAGSIIKVVNASIDLNFLRDAPVITGYTWISIFKAFKSIKNMQYKKKLLFCFMTEVTVKSTRKNWKGLM